jgi:hypothetical protein
MSSTDQDEPTAKLGRRNRKKGPRKPKPDLETSPPPDRPQPAERIEASIAPPGPAPTEAAAPVDADADGPACSAPVSFQTIANAYGDFTRKSLEETRSFVERLTGARSLDKAMEVQTEFARQAYKTFVTESQKIRDLHGELAKQTLGPLTDLVAKASRDKG